MQDIEASHPLITSNDIGRGVAFRVADMQTLARGIREHVKHIKFRLGAILVGPKCRVFLPVALPFRLNALRVVSHFCLYPLIWPRRQQQKTRLIGGLHHLKSAR
jgi:hypothetical protein